MRSAATAFTLLLVGGAVAWVTSRRITTPLSQVTEAAEAVAESKPHVHVDIDREDAIGRLADSFNTMATKVGAARRHLDRVKLNARRMGQLIDDLLAFSQIGRATMLRQSLDMQAMATAVARDAVAVSGRPVELTIDVLPQAYGEAALVNQVLVNLISNAIKFTAKVDKPAIVIGARDSGGETAYFVRDNGVEFDQRYVEKLFGVFQCLHCPEEFEGTGVGLAIVHRIVSRHSGRVWAEGKINAGATFYFTLPSAKPTNGQSAARVENKTGVKT